MKDRALHVLIPPDSMGLAMSWRSKGMSQVMKQEIEKASKGHISPFEQIKRTNDAGTEYWSSRDFAEVLGYGDYRNFEGVIEKAKLSCFNSGYRVEDHFGDVTEMVEIGNTTLPEKQGR